MTADREATYRLEAQKCLDLAESINDPGIKAELRKIAADWLALAERVKRENT